MVICMTSKLKIPDTARSAGRGIALFFAAILFFLISCLTSTATIKSTSVLLIFLTLAGVFLFYGRLRDRIQLPMAALGLVVLMDGLSNLYAVSGKFALYEFLKVLAAFCLALLMLAFTGEHNPGRQAASVLEGCTAIAGLASIDLLSTRWISTAVLDFLKTFTPDYSNLAAVEDGVRMTSIYMNPNVFAGCAGIGVLLSFGLAVSAKGGAERTLHLICLYANALSFVLAFSLGACLAILPGFLVLLALERPENRIRLFFLMLGTFLLTMLAAFPISLTSLSAWDGVQPIPLLCLAAGAAALCLLDCLCRRAAARLSGHYKAVLGLTAGILVAVILFVIAACLLTTSIALQPGAPLRRAAYLDPGKYTLAAKGGEGVQVLVESQNREETMMHTSTELYSGTLLDAAFTVPKGSAVVYFNFTADTETVLESVTYHSAADSGEIALGYRLLPAFAANRLQGLFANQNAIQRFVFFEDGLKLFRRSPLLGMGMGAFENGVKSVQSFPYVTKYVHNHYIQTLAETGIAGLCLFLGLLAISAVAVWKGRRKPLAPALGAALVFMALHGAVEVVFSAYPYLPMAFGVIAVINLTCGDCVTVPKIDAKRGVRSALLLGACGLLAAFGILLNCNRIAQKIANQAETLPELQRAIRLDRFEWADHMLAYVICAADTASDSTERQQADVYAERLAKLHSNTVPFYLAKYYLETGRSEQGLEMAEKYISYVSSDASLWQQTFDLLLRYETTDAAYRDGVRRIAERMDVWNAENMGEIAVDEEAQALIARARG